MLPPHPRGTAGRVPPPPRSVDPRRTIVDTIWQAHLGESAPDGRDVVSVDRIYLHERQLGLLARLGRSGVEIGYADRVVACTDQQLPTRARRVDDADPTDPADLGGSAQVLAALERLEASSALYEVPVFGPGDHRGGVLNVVGPEQGMTLPGSLVVGTDAHMSTHGAFGAVALDLSDDELGDVLRAGVIRRHLPDVVRVSVSGALHPRADAKDLALWVLGRLGPRAARGAILELGGAVVGALPMDGRLTLCNMAAESGALSAVVQPDEITVAYLEGRPFSPSGADWDDAVERWSALRTGAHGPLSGDLVLLAAGIGPHASWGTEAWQVAELGGVVPSPDPRDPARRRAEEAALREQGLVPGTPLDDVEIDQVFLGSCANARLDDIRRAAEVLRGRRVRVPTWVVPGSRTVAREAEAEGLHRVLRDAGVEWREPGCSLCIGANGDAVAPGTRLASTANRPHRGRVGPGARVHVMSPASAAAAALTGRLTDPRRLD